MTENQSVQKWWRHHLEEIDTPPKRSNPVFSIFRPVLYQILTFRICACFAELRQNPSLSPKMVCRFQISKPQGSTLAVYRSRVRSVWFWGVRYRTPVRGYRDLDSSYRDLLARTLISWGIYRFAQRSWFGLVRFRYHLNKSQIELLWWNCKLVVNQTSLSLSFSIINLPLRAVHPTSEKQNASCSKQKRGCSLWHSWQASGKPWLHPEYFQLKTVWFKYLAEHSIRDVQNLYSRWK